MEKNGLTVMTVTRIMILLFTSRHIQSRRNVIFYDGERDTIPLGFDKTTSKPQQHFSAKYT